MIIHGDWHRAELFEGCRSVCAAPVMREREGPWFAVARVAGAEEMSRRRPCGARGPEGLLQGTIRRFLAHVAYEERGGHGRVQHTVLCV